MGLVLSVSTIDLEIITGNIFIGVMCLALINVLKMLIYIVLVSTFALAVLSWINPFSPVMSLLHGMTAPFMNVFRKRIPRQLEESIYRHFLFWWLAKCYLCGRSSQCIA